jgi:D-xylose 1-dehydrogenase (NADP+, D-xylono-1,5-lactone-forming)
MRWGILGAARINRSLIPAFRAADGEALVAVGSRDAGRAARYAAEWEIPQAFTSYEALLAEPAIDAVYIPLPNRLHADWTIRALRAGKHVLCEKPLALSVEEIDQVAAAAREAGRHVAEAFMYRHHPQTALVRTLVAAGAIGELRLIRGAFSFVLDRPGDVRFDAALGGGCLWDVGCYPVSYARVVAGAEPVRVQGMAVTGATGIDLSFAAVLRFPGDVVAMADASFITQFRAGLEVVGTAGILTVPQPFKPGVRGVVHLTRGDTVEERTTEARPLYVQQILDFSSAARGETTPVVSLADSRANTAALVALHESARTGRAVTL